MRLTGGRIVADDRLQALVYIAWPSALILQLVLHLVVGHRVALVIVLFGQRSPI
jgi:hypothetical protein